ncbi:MAG: hypothetical protein BWK76_01720 [Desulfobulbaceae bacterium A2]|nr:MAG: hypothetical protein BWK76_01720 [Desulfobulbaceae bacterium A2]
MPVYEYIALDAEGGKHQGLVEDDSEAAVRGRLRELGRYPVEIRQAGLGAVETGSGRLRRFFPARVPTSEVLAAVRQLATLLGAGMPLVQALSLLVEQCDTPELRRRLAQVREQVNEGGSLAAALAKHPRLFSRVAVNMVRAGEASGSLELVLTQLADLGERQLAMQRRVRSALVYPLFMAVVGAGVLFILMTGIMPNISRVFQEMQQALPLPTRMLIAASGLLSRWWWLLAGMAVLTVFVIRRLLQHPGPRRRWDSWRLRLPWWGSMEVRLASVRLARTLGGLLHAGVPLVKALEIVQHLLVNTVLAEALAEAANAVEHGVGLGQALRRQGRFPPLLAQMISVGEQSGGLAAMLDSAAESTERDVEARLLIMVSLIEPVMILFMGLAVGAIVLAILLPIVELNQLVR